MSAPELLLFSFIIMCVLGVLLQIFLLLEENRRKQRRNEQRIIATVVRIDQEIETWRDKWYVTVSWSDRQTGQIHTFRGRPLTSRPALNRGEQVRIAFDPQKPQLFRILRP